MKRTSSFFLIIIFIGLLLISGCLNKETSDELRNKKITIYKSNSCGCCDNYVDYIEGFNLNVEVVTVQNIDLIKEENNIPINMQSCHTIIIGDYFVEGHVPIEAVERLISEKPDVNGIALPGMPSGSPGMPGSKNEKWIIYAIKNGEYTEFMKI